MASSLEETFGYPLPFQTLGAATHRVCAPGCVVLGDVTGGALGLRSGHLTHTEGGKLMNNIIYIVGLIVVVLAVLSFFGLR